MNIIKTQSESIVFSYVIIELLLFCKREYSLLLEINVELELPIGQLVKQLEHSKTTLHQASKDSLDWLDNRQHTTRVAFGFGLVNEIGDQKPFMR